MWSQLKLVVEYEGTGYSGFQRQKNGRSIQGEIERAFSEIVQHPVQITGAGRTDAGVHALGQVCHAKVSTAIPKEKLCLALNTALPRDIIVKEIGDAPKDFHARYEATNRAYAYFVLNRPAPTALFRNHLWWYPRPLDVRGMNSACKHLLGSLDFSSFAKRGSDRKIPRTTVHEIRCFRGTGKLKVPFASMGKEIITFHIEAQNFLYGMVRAIMGTLIEIGEKKRAPDDMLKILNAKNRKFAGPAAPAKGLYLLRVDYPDKFR